MSAAVVRTPAKRSMRVASFEHPKQVARPFQPFGAMALSVAILMAIVPLARAADFTDQLTRAQGYEYGEGLPKDQLVAAAMYCDAARAGSAEAAFRLGWMYANGRGVAHDDATAAALFNLAAGEGHVYAQRMLRRLGDAHALLPDCMRPPGPMIALAQDDNDALDDGDAGPDPFENLPPYKQKIAELVNRVAPGYGIEPRLALAVIAVESNFDALARSVKDARGLMQLVPQTAARF